MQDEFQVGAVASVHGIRGEVKVFPTTDDPAKFKRLKTVMLKTEREQREAKLLSVRFFKNMVILKFKGFDNINDIEIYKGKDLLITRDQAVKLGPDENFIVDLIGLSVVSDEGEDLGTLTDVLLTGANDVYEVTMPHGKKLLLPAIRQCILNVDLDEGKVLVHVLDGLMDL